MQELSAGKMPRVTKIKETGFLVPEETSVIKNLLAVITSFNEETENEINAETNVPSSKIDQERLLRKIDAYVLAGALVSIIKNNKSTFIQKAIDYSLKTKGIVNTEEMMLAKEAFIAGVLNAALYNYATKNNQALREIYIGNSLDLVKAFFIGAGITFLGSLGRLAAKKKELEDDKLQNEQINNPADPSQQFSETPGKSNINKAASRATEQNIQEAERVLNPANAAQLNKEEVQGADTAAGDKINIRRIELLGYRDFFSYVNNILYRGGQFVILANSMMQKLMKHSFREFLEETAAIENVSSYTLTAAKGKSSERKKSRDGKGKEKKNNVFIDSSTYEMLALLTLMSRDLAETYLSDISTINNIRDEEEQMMQQEEAMAQQQEMESQEQMSAAPTEEQQQMEELKLQEQVAKTQQAEKKAAAEGEGMAKKKKRK